MGSTAERSSDEGTRVHGPGSKSWEDVAKPEIDTDTDAIVRVDTVTICGTDLHILKGDVPEVTDALHGTSLFLSRVDSKAAP
jgi:threonine dehydrogenase-like Zn-dependent dehydrogenase